MTRFRSWAGASGLVPCADPLGWKQRLAVVREAIDEKLGEIYDRGEPGARACPTEEEWAWLGRAYRDLDHLYRENSHHLSVEDVVDPA